MAQVHQSFEFVALRIGGMSLEHRKFYMSDYSHTMPYIYFVGLNHRKKSIHLISDDLMNNGKKMSIHYPLSAWNFDFSHPRTWFNHETIWNNMLLTRTRCSCFLTSMVAVLVVQPYLGILVSQLTQAISGPTSAGLSRWYHWISIIDWVRSPKLMYSIL